MNQYKFAQLYDKGGDLNKRWFVGYYYKHPETAKYSLFKIWISTSLKTKQARRSKANQIIDNIDNKLRQGFNPFQNENIGFTNIVEALNKVLEIKASFTRYRTITSYRSYIKNFVDWLKQNNHDTFAVESISSQDALKYSDYLKINRKLSNRTHNNNIEHLRAVFAVLVEREYILRNPFKSVKLLPEEQRNIFAYSHNEIELLKNYCIISDPKLWLVCQFIYYCAIRPNELVQLQIKFIDLVNKKIYIPSYVSKNKKQSVILIPEPFVIELKKLELEKLQQEDYLFSRNLLPGDYKIYPNRLAERFKIVANNIGLHRRLYDLKHTGAGMVLEAGANIHDLQLHLRHSDIKITNEYLKAFKSQPSEDFRNKFPAI